MRKALQDKRRPAAQPQGAAASGPQGAERPSATGPEAARPRSYSRIPRFSVHDAVPDSHYTFEDLLTMGAKGYHIFGKYLLGPHCRHFPYEWPGPKVYHPQPLQMHHLFKTTDAIEGRSTRTYVCRCPVCAEETWSTRDVVVHIQIDSKDTDPAELAAVSDIMNLEAHESLHRTPGMHASQLLEMFLTNNSEAEGYLAMMYWVYYAPLGQNRPVFHEDPDLSRHYKRYVSLPLKPFTPADAVDLQIPVPLNLPDRLVRPDELIPFEHITQDPYPLNSLYQLVHKQHFGYESPLNSHVGHYHHDINPDPMQGSLYLTKDDKEFVFRPVDTHVFEEAAASLELVNQPAPSPSMRY